MSIKKIIAGIAAAAVSAAFMTFSAFAQDIDVNKDFKTDWTVSATIPGSKFSDVNENTVFTIKYTVDASLADDDAHSYWVIKPMVDDTGWPFIAGISQLRLSESGDSYELDTDKTEASFTMPTDAIEHFQTAGMAIMGHGVVLETITFSNDISIDDAGLVIQTAESAPSDDAAADTADDAFTTTSPKTGNNSIAVSVCVMALAASAMVITRKK